VETIWGVVRLDDDTYEFTFFPLGVAGVVRIESAAGGDPIEVANREPFATQNTFTQRLDPGDYTLSWNWMQGRPDRRQSADFTVPFDGDAMAIQIPFET
jgi:hypothetical protein